jgi:ABC-type multidrug transport system ATPase subunit
MTALLAPRRGVAAPVAAPEPADPALELWGVTMRWRGRDPRVLDELDLLVERGRVVHVVGRNGAGKTTLLRVASGLLTPERGIVCLTGLSPERDRRQYQRRLGLLQAGDHGLYARMTVRRHLHFWTGLYALPRAGRDEAVAGALERFALTELAGRRVDRLSTGQRQRVRLASAFIHRPRLVLLDEPRNSLDEEGLELLAAAVADHAAEGGAVLWCSPAVESGDLPCDAVYRLERGRLTAV